MKQLGSWPRFWALSLSSNSGAEPSNHLSWARTRSPEFFLLSFAVFWCLRDQWLSFNSCCWFWWKQCSLSFNPSPNPLSANRNTVKGSRFYLGSSNSTLLHPAGEELIHPNRWNILNGEKLWQKKNKIQWSFGEGHLAVEPDCYISFYALGTEGCPSRQTTNSKNGGETLTTYHVCIIFPPSTQPHFCCIPDWWVKLGYERLPSIPACVAPLLQSPTEPALAFCPLDIKLQLSRIIFPKELTSVTYWTAQLYLNCQSCIFIDLYFTRKK